MLKERVNCRAISTHMPKAHLPVSVVILERHTMSILHSWGAETFQVFSDAALDRISCSTVRIKYMDTTCIKLSILHFWPRIWCTHHCLYNTHLNWSSVLNSWTKFPPKTRESTGVNTACIQPATGNKHICGEVGACYTIGLTRALKSMQLYMHTYTHNL